MHNIACQSAHTRQKYKNHQDRKDNIIWCLKRFHDGTTKETLSKITDIPIKLVAKLVGQLEKSGWVAVGPDSIRVSSVSPFRSKLVRLVSVNGEEGEMISLLSKRRRDI